MGAGMTSHSSYYVGPDRGRWIPSSWDDVVSAAAAGVLDETHWVELKREIPRSSRPANLELAKDLASLAVDGGLLVVGVADNGGRAGAVVGAELGGLAQRIDQVARDRIHPPLMVMPRELPHPTDDGRGCVLVSVPASPGAPHMVDGLYWGRSSTGKRVLTDSDVRRILELRQPDTEAFLVDLRSMVDDDPFPAGERTQSHLYVLAKPLSARDDALVPLLTDSSVSTNVAEVLEAIRRVRPATEDFQPDVHGATQQTRRAAGLGFSSHNAERPYEPGFVDFVIRWDGAVALMCGRGSDQRLGRITESEDRILFPSTVLGLVYAAVALAGRLADTHGAYQGEWTVGVRLDRMRGVRAWSADAFGRVTGHAYTAEGYEQVVYTTTSEMVEAPQQVTERLVSRLLRGLGVERQHLPYARKQA
jgi:hypothetical protein